MNAAPSLHALERPPEVMAPKLTAQDSDCATAALRSEDRPPEAWTPELSLRVRAASMLSRAAASVSEAAANTYYRAGMMPGNAVEWARGHKVAAGLGAVVLGAAAYKAGVELTHVAEQSSPIPMKPLANAAPLGGTVRAHEALSTPPPVTMFDPAKLKVGYASGTSAKSAMHFVSTKQGVNVEYSPASGGTAVDGQQLAAGQLKGHAALEGVFEVKGANGSVHEEGVRIALPGNGNSLPVTQGRLASWIKHYQFSQLREVFIRKGHREVVLSTVVGHGQPVSEATLTQQIGHLQHGSVLQQGNVLPAHRHADNTGASGVRRHGAPRASRTPHAVRTPQAAAAPRHAGVRAAPSLTEVNTVGNMKDWAAAGLVLLADAIAVAGVGIATKAAKRRFTGKRSSLGSHLTLVVPGGKKRLTPVVKGPERSRAFRLRTRFKKPALPSLPKPSMSRLRSIAEHLVLVEAGEETLARRAWTKPAEAMDAARGALLDPHDRFAVKVLSLLDRISGAEDEWRDYAISELSEGLVQAYVGMAALAAGVELEERIAVVERHFKALRLPLNDLELMLPSDVNNGLDTHVSSETAQAIAAALFDKFGALPKAGGLFESRDAQWALDDVAEELESLSRKERKTGSPELDESLTTALWDNLLAPLIDRDSMTIEETIQACRALGLGPDAVFYDEGIGKFTVHGLPLARQLLKLRKTALKLAA